MSQHSINSEDNIFKKKVILEDDVSNSNPIPIPNPNPTEIGLLITKLDDLIEEQKKATNAMNSSVEAMNKSTAVMNSSVKVMNNAVKEMKLSIQNQEILTKYILKLMGEDIEKISKKK